MRVSELASGAFARLLRQGNLLVDLKPFAARLTSDVPGLAANLQLLYAEFEILAPDQFADFHVAIAREHGLRRWLKPQARFFFDGRPSFTPLGNYQAIAMLEWGLNWCVAAHAHQYLIIHAAVVERDGFSAVLPAPPGSGKSTLCAALIHRGWRLLTDELALLDLSTGSIHGMARPINLKNASIQIIQQFAPDAVMTASVPNTTKGTVALVRPPAQSVARRHDPARATCIVLPRYQANAGVNLERQSRADTFILLAQQSFNYHIHGQAGFKAVQRLLDQSECYQLTYSRLDDGIRAFDQLARGTGT